MKREDYKNMSADERALKLKELQKDLFELKFKFKLGQSKDSASITKIKRDIARIKTYHSLEENYAN